MADITITRGTTPNGNASAVKSPFLSQKKGHALPTLTVSATVVSDSRPDFLGAPSEDVVAVGSKQPVSSTHGQKIKGNRSHPKREEPTGFKDAVQKGDLAYIANKTPVRYAGYANDMAQSLKGLLVNTPLYNWINKCVELPYILFASAGEGINKFRDSKAEGNSNGVAFVDGFKGGAEGLAFQGIASMIMPAVVTEQMKQMINKWFEGGTLHDATHKALSEVFLVEKVADPIMNSPLMQWMKNISISKNGFLHESPAEGEFKPVTQARNFLREKIKLPFDKEYDLKPVQGKPENIFHSTEGFEKLGSVAPLGDLLESPKLKAQFPDLAKMLPNVIELGEEALEHDASPLVKAVAEVAKKASGHVDEVGKQLFQAFEGPKFAFKGNAIANILGVFLMLTFPKTVDPVAEWVLNKTLIPAFNAVSEKIKQWGIA